MSAINNSTPLINKNTYALLSSFSANVDSDIQVTMKHQFQKVDAELTEFSSVTINGGSAERFFYQLSRGIGQPGLYFSSSLIDVKMTKHLEGTNISGFYEFQQNVYLFGAHRQVELGSGYRRDGTSIEMGARMENIGRSLAVQYFAAAGRDLKYVVGSVQAKVQAGTQYVVDGMRVNTPKFGFKMEVKGQWLFLGMPSDLHFSYSINGLLINRAEGVYRRFGAKIGLVYLY